MVLVNDPGKRAFLNEFIGYMWQIHCVYDAKAHACNKNIVALEAYSARVLATVKSVMGS